jgi:mannose-6-phosphate isomerase-like protein (cupin superfamily)
MEDKDYLDILKSQPMKRIKKHSEPIILMEDTDTFELIENKILSEGEGIDIKGEITKFFLANPNPDDEQVHKFAEEKGINPHELETQIYSILSDKLKNSPVTEQAPPPRTPDTKDIDIRNIEDETISNNNFRKVLYTGKNSQLVVMSLKPGEDIGMEVHPEGDQFFRIEEGDGEFQTVGKAPVVIKGGSSVLVKAGTQHNVINKSASKPLKLYTIYSPPHHPPDRLNKTKEDAVKEEKAGE